jgi:hypothetical protein
VRAVCCRTCRAVAGEGGKRIAEFPGSSYSDACPKPKQKLQNDQNQNLTKIISRSFGCCPSRNR